MPTIDFRVVLGVLATLLFIELLAFGIDDPYATIVAPAFGLAALSFVAPFLLHRPIDVFAPPVFGAIPMLMVLASTAAYWFTEGTLELKYLELLGDEERAWLIVKVLLCMCLGQICYLVGFYFFKTGPRLTRYFPDVQGNGWNTSRLQLITGILILISAVGYTYFQEKLGVGFADPTAIGRARGVITRHVPESSWMARTILAVFIPFYLYLARFAASKRTWLLLGLCGLLAAVAYLISRTGGRALFMAPLMACFMLFHYLWKRLRISLILFLAVGAIFFSNVFGDYRFQVQNQQNEDLDQTISESETGPLAVLGNLARQRKSFFVIPLLFHSFPELHDHLLGQTYWGLGVALIPRWIWPNKLDFNEWHETKIVTNLVGAAHPTPYIALLWVNFSYPGIILGFLLWGVFQRGLYEWLLRAQHDPGVVVMYTMIVTFFSTPTLMSVAETVQYVVPVWVILKLIRLRSAPARAAPSPRPTARLAAS